jgi:cytosine/creatinine deaminase
MPATRAGSRTAFLLDTDSDATAIAELPDMRMGFKNGCQVFKRRQPTLFRP